MSGTYVTDAGFVKPTLAEIKVQLETLFQAVFGLGVDLDPDGPVGQIVGLLARREALIWDGLEEVYTSRDPKSSTGVSLDNLAAEVGIYRLPATPTKVEAAILYGDQNAVVPSGSKARLAELPDQTYSLDTNITISPSTFAEVQLDPSKGLGVYTVVLDGTAFSVSIPTSTEKDGTIDAMIPVIVANAKWEADRIDGPLLRIRPKIGLTPGVLGALTGYTLKTVGSYGDFTGDTSGALACPEGALNEIATPISGWTGVFNREAGQIGREAELDESLRIRRAVGFRGGLATEAAILAGLYDDVEGLTSANIWSNRTLATDTNGLPPKSFEVTAVGGVDVVIAASIWRTMPAGIESFGNIVDSRDSLPGILIEDSQGFPQRVFFSRPVGVYIWVRAKVRLSSEEAVPSDWQAAIKSAILDLVGEEIRPGKDVVYQNLFKAIYKVSGIDFVDLAIGKSSSSTATEPDAWLVPHQDGGVWVDEKISISARRYAAFDVTRISVELL